MAWSSSKGRIRGKIASGGFAQPDNTLAKAIDTGSSLMAQGIMKRAEEERAEERKRKAEAAAAARRHAAAQAKKEEAARKNERQVNAIAARYAVDPSNTQAIDYLRSQVEAFGTSAAALIDADYKDGKIKFPVVEEVREVQGPDVAPDFQVNVDGIEGTVAVDDLEAISAEMLRPEATDDPEATRDSAREQMNILAPVSEIEPEVIRQQGFVVDPNAEKVDIDWMTVDKDSVKNIRRLHDSGQQVLSNKELAVLKIYEDDFAAARDAELTKANLEAVRGLAGKGEDYLQDVVSAPTGQYPADFVSTAQAMLDKKVQTRQAEEQTAALDATISSINSFASMTAPERQNTIDALNALAPKSDKAQLALDAISAMTAEAGVDTKSFYTNVSTVASLEAKIKLAERSLTGNAKTAVLADLNALLEDRKSEETDLGLTEMVFYGNISIGGTPVQAELVLMDSGDYYSTSQQKVYKKSEVSELISQDNQEGLVSDATKIQTAVFNPMLEQRAGIQTLLRQAKTIDDLVKQSDGKVLTFIGGRLPSLVNRIMNEYKSFEAFAASADKGAITQLATQEMPSSAELAELGISANQFARFNSQAIEFAFTYARTGMGQQRTTDQDFQAAFKVVTAGSGYDTYTQSLRELTQKGIKRAVDEHDNFLTHPTLKAAMLRPGATDTYGDMAVPLMDFLASKGSDVEAQIAWANGQGMTQTATDNPPPEASGAGATVSVTAALNNYMSGANMSADKDLYLGTDEENRALLLSILSKKTGLPASLLKQKYEE